MFYNSHSNIFQFIDSLKSLKTDLYIKNEVLTSTTVLVTQINEEPFLRQAKIDF